MASHRVLAGLALIVASTAAIFAAAAVETGMPTAGLAVAAVALAAGTLLVGTSGDGATV